jgi:putative transposase
MATVGSRARRSRAQWQSLVAEAECSPLGVRAFCAEQGISTASFYLWRQRLGAQRDQDQAVPEAVNFLDLGALAAHAGAGAPDAGGWELELALGDGLVLRLRRR